MGRAIFEGLEMNDEIFAKEMAAIKESSLEDWELLILSDSEGKEFELRYRKDGKEFSYLLDNAVEPFREIIMTVNEFCKGIPISYLYTESKIQLLRTKEYEFWTFPIKAKIKDAESFDIFSCIENDEQKAWWLLHKKEYSIALYISTNEAEARQVFVDTSLYAGLMEEIKRIYENFKAEEG